VTFPPSSVFADPSFDGEAARSEALVRLRGLADHFEKEDPAMHKTNTVDYAVVYDGEIWLELDDAKTIRTTGRRITARGSGEPSGVASSNRGPGKYS
jgi:hypothetical protein